MDKKQMYVADVNTVFGKNEESLVSHIDDTVLPALTSEYVYRSTEKTKYFFKEVGIRKLGDEYVLSGLLIKDTILEIKSEYSREEGLKETDKKINSAPYSLFLIYLKNHRMMLIKNQDGSPDIRGFQTAFRNIIKIYIREYNEHLKNDASIETKEFLEYPKVNVAGIKTAMNVKEALSGVKKITEMTVNFYPLNAEWDMQNIFSGIDDKIRKKVGSSKGKIVLRSPKDIDGVAELIEQSEGLVKTNLKVEYRTQNEQNKKRGTIKDNEISAVSDIDVVGDLKDAYGQMDNIKQGIASMNVVSQNNVVEYEEFLRKRNIRG